MRDNLDWWMPAQMAISCIMDVMPREQRIAAEEQLKLMAIASENKGEHQTALFCRALAGEEYLAPAPKPTHLKIVK